MLGALLQSRLNWTGLMARTGRTARASEIRDLLAVTERPDMISFAGGLPAPELFPVARLRAALDAVLREEPVAALQYGPTQGQAALRSLIAGRLARRGVECSPDEVLITTGSQQALDLLGRVLACPGLPVVVESPTYIGALQAFGAQQVEFVPAPVDAGGLLVDRLRSVLERGRAAGRPHPCLLYTVPTFQNPAGVTMPAERRLDLLDCSREWSLPVVEDDPYWALRYDGEETPPLRGLPGGEDVLHLGTFSKVLSPGLRLGWVVAPRPVIERLVLAKQGADLHTDSLAQRAALRFCRDNDLDAHVASLRAAYRERRDAMLAALAELMPAGTTWTVPAGGMFTWVTLPAGLDARAVLAEAVALGVAFVPGDAFHVDGGGTSAARLNFTASGPAEIREGVRRLALATERAGG
jgi:2-aminoadipate transaminase